MPVKTEPHMGHFANQLCMGILMLSEPWHLETAKIQSSASLIAIHWEMLFFFF